MTKDINLTKDNSTKPLHSTLPDWFYNNRIKLAEELGFSSNPLGVCDFDPTNPDGFQACETVGGAIYQVDEVEYEPLLNLCNLKKVLDPEQDATAPSANFFTHEAALICFPQGGTISGSQRFFESVVQRFARDIHADLVTLSLQDINDIKQWRSGWKPIGHDENLVDTMPFGQSTIPFAALLKSPLGKLERLNKEASRTHEAPLVLHLPEVEDLARVWGSEILGRIEDAMPENGIVLLSNAKTVNVPVIYGPYIRCRNEMPNERCNGALKCSADTSTFKPIRITPVRTTNQRELLETDNAAEKTYQFANIRLLQRSLRRVSVQHWSMPLLQPFDRWDFLQGTHTRTYLAEHSLEETDLKKIIGELNNDESQDQIKKVLDKFGRRKKSAEPWMDGSEKTDQWSTFADHVQATLRSVQSGGGENEWERTFLKNLVDPREMEDGWGNIALETDIKDAVQRLVSQATKSGISEYGVLKNHRIRGALLYGPPGTGKTHLARVLAKESGSVMICVSAADIINKYIGETEKAAQALFSLARKLSPCVIFIDEADALFRPRSSNDRTWERNLINQMLMEMDGLKKSKKSPFVLLATNLPHQLDHALLRRVTSRVHIGLPSANVRLSIWKILLREEILNSNVDFNSLVQKSAGYSGSDIQNVCVQAATYCSTFRDDGKRILGALDFNMGFSKCAPTTSKQILQDLAAFAKEFNPPPTPPESSEEENDSEKDGSADSEP